MAKTFYSAMEAAEKLGRGEAELKDLVRAGKLREFRDAGTVNYKVSDVDALTKAAAPPAKPAPAAKSGVARSPGGSKAGSSIASASASGEIVLLRKRRRKIRRAVPQFRRLA
jgi:hypothetical protein